LPASGVTIARKSATVSLGLSQPQKKQQPTHDNWHLGGELGRIRILNGGDWKTKAAWSSKVRWCFQGAEDRPKGKGRNHKGTSRNSVKVIYLRQDHMGN